jgi:hypothetical protein
MQPWYSGRTNFDQCAGISLPVGGEMIIQRQVPRGASRGNAIGWHSRSQRMSGVDRWYALRASACTESPFSANLPVLSRRNAPHRLHQRAEHHALDAILRVWKPEEPRRSCLVFTYFYHFEGSIAFGPAADSVLEAIAQGRVAGAIMEAPTQGNRHMGKGRQSRRHQAAMSERKANAPPADQLGKGFSCAI